MKLLIDCGATKADWAVSGGKTFRTEGFNLAHTPREKLSSILDGAAGKIGPGVTEVHFYAAGLVGESPVDMGRWFPGAAVEYASDMVGAARAVLGREEGVAAIIGTGANTCLWDGSKILRQIPCGGFILGDDGSAATLGRLFLADYIKGLVPVDIGLSYEEAVEKVYRSDAPARFLGSLAPMILEHYAEPYFKELVDRNFRAFIRRAVLPYGRGPVGVVGGFGYKCREIVRALGAEYGVEFKIFMESPLEGLLKYHGI